MVNTKQVNSQAYYQHTLRNSFSCIGRGLHSGMQVIMTVMPAPANTGFRFIRRDVKKDCNEVLAAWYTVSDTQHCTTIANLCGVRVSAIEHLIAALYVCDIDNAMIVLSGPEVPFMDGSAKAFIELIDSAGAQPQANARRAIVVKKPLTVHLGDKQACLLPYDKPWVELEIDKDTPSCVGGKNVSTAIDYDTVKREIACARTFGFNNEALSAQHLGFARGGPIDNTVVVKNGEIVNASGLRFDDEFIRHKVLDTIGDLALSGAPIIGYFNGKYTGHQLNNILLRKLMSAGNNYDYCNFSDLSCFRRNLAAK